MIKTTNAINLSFSNYLFQQQMHKKGKRFPFRVVFNYIVIGELWIMISDKVLSLTVNDIGLLNKIQTFKGSFFIIITSIFLYIICNNLLLTKELLEKTIEEDKVQAQFFANLSHDLKTPLNIIFTSIQMIQLHWQNTFEYSNKYTNIIRQNCYRLIKLINNITDIAKFDYGFRDIKLKNYNIVKVVEDISLSVVEYLEHKGIEFVFDTEVEEKVMACDTDKIERIMLNLLSNAGKFTKDGGKVWVNIYDKVESIVISVKDTGQGIPKEKQKIIFEKFIKISNPYDKQEYQGSGIGLFVVKSLVEMHGGKISCISECGKGSEFIVELPVTILSEESDMHEQITNNNKEDCIEKINIEFSDIYFNEE